MRFYSWVKLTYKGSQNLTPLQFLQFLQALIKKKFNWSNSQCKKPSTEKFSNNTTTLLLISVLKLTRMVRLKFAKELRIWINRSD